MGKDVAGEGEGKETNDELDNMISQAMLFWVDPEAVTIQLKLMSP